MKKPNKKTQNKSGNNPKKPNMITADQFIHDSYEFCSILEQVSRQRLATLRETKVALKKLAEAQKQRILHPSELKKCLEKIAEAQRPHFSKPEEIKNALNHIRANKITRGEK